MTEVNEIVVSCRDAAVEKTGQLFDDIMSDFGQNCESPIEVAFLAGVASLVSVPPFGEFVRFAHREPDDDVGVPGELCVYTQPSVGKYRADFMFVLHGRDGRPQDRIAVECDGHNFHEKTKEQAERDKSRDRYFAAANITTMRFTGREIWRSPINCAREVFQAVVRRRSVG